MSCRERAGLPHVFAHGRPHKGLAVLDEEEISSRREVPVLVEHAVVRQEPLAVDGPDLAPRADVAGVVEVAVEVWSTDEQGRSARLDGDPLDRLLGGADEARAKEEIFGGIAGHGELREDDEVGTVRLRLAEAAEDQLAVAVEIADDRVDLDERKAHAKQSSCLRLSVENYRGGRRLATSDLHDPAAKPLVRKAERWRGLGEPGGSSRRPVSDLPPPCPRGKPLPPRRGRGDGSGGTGRSPQDTR